MEKLKVGDCLLGKGPDEWDEDCIGLYRVLDIEDDICEAYCYEITDRGYYKEMTEIELPISPDFKIIPVEIHDKITNLINEAISSSLSIIADAKTRPVSSIKTGDCFIISSTEYESIRICKIINIDIEGDNEDSDTRYSTLDYIVDKNELGFSNYRTMTKFEMIHDHQAVSISSMEFDKIEKIYSMLQRAIETLIREI